MKNRRTLNTEQTMMTLQATVVMMLQATVVQPETILDCRTLNTKQGATIPLHKFYKMENIISSLGKFIFIFLQGLRQLIFLKTKDKFTPLTIIGVTKIMCNTPHFMWYICMKIHLRETNSRIHSRETNSRKSAEERTH